MQGPDTRFVSPTPVLWDQTWLWPTWDAAHIVIGQSTVGASALPNNAVTPITGTYSLLVATGGESIRWAAGRPGAQAAVGGINGKLWFLPYWNPAFQDAQMNPGATVPTPSAVAVFDFFFRLSTGAFGATPADTNGFWFWPSATAAGTPPAPNDAPPGQAAPSGGFGLCFNSDGGAGTAVEFISYDNTGAVLVRTAAPAAAVPDITSWSAARIAVVSAYDGSPAYVQTWLNGYKVATQAFDGVALLNPNEHFPTKCAAFGFGYCFRNATAAMTFSIQARMGRTLPSGISVQGI